MTDIVLEEDVINTALENFCFIQHYHIVKNANWDQGLSIMVETLFFSKSHKQSSLTGLENVYRLKQKVIIFKALTHSQPIFHFYSPWKQQKTGGFLMFSGGIEVEHWLKMG